MSQFNAGPEKGYEANVDIANAVAVKLSSGKAVIATAATDAIVGVTNGAAKAGQVANVRLRSASGTVKVKLGGTVAVGDALTANASGLLITTTTAGNQIVGVALEAGVSGDIIEASLSTAKY